MTVFTEVCLCTALIAHTTKSLFELYGMMAQIRSDKESARAYAAANRQAEWDLGVDSTYQEDGDA